MHEPFKTINLQETTPRKLIELLTATSNTISKNGESAFDNLAKELKPFLISNDGIIEGAYNLEKKIICVQFHMENNGVSEKLTSNIINKFLDLL